jgi:unsaturated rhamnogalacturonyl hydrolase
MKHVFIVILIIISSCATAQTDPVLVTVKRNYSIPKSSERVTISIDWQRLIFNNPALEGSSFVIVDRNFGKTVSGKLVDNSNDKRADYLVFDYTFQSNEPIFSFLIRADKGKSEKTEFQELSIDKRLEVSILKSFADHSKEQKSAKTIAEKLVQTTLNLYPDPKDFPIYAPNRWNYEYSFFLLGSYKLGKKVNNPAFIEYPKRWLDGFINESGGFRKGVYDMSEYKLDDVIPARLAILFHQETGESKYKSIVDTIVTQLTRQPKTKEGGYWHKQVYEHQMWLDGIFMADVFSMQYAQAYNKPEWYDEAVHQIKLIYKHTRDEKTGLLYHGWDEAKNPAWAHPVKGTSPEFWGRAIGWYVMSLVECLDFLPPDHPERKDVIEIFRNVCTSVIKYQHKENRLWYQVIDKSDQPGNWPEASASAMFVYAFAKGFNQKYLDESFRDSAEEGFNAILKNFVFADDQQNLHLDQTVKIGTLNPKTSKGDFEYYVTTERRIDDYKGLASLLYASMELNR